MRKRVTIVDIALKVGITPSTVSKVFSNHPRISTLTCDEVFKTAKALGYQPNVLATGLRKGRSGLIGFVAMSFTPSINTLDQRCETMGSLAAKLLIDHLAASQDRGSYIVHREMLER